VAFVADHGEAFGEQGLWFRHEGVIPAVLRVPLVLAGPGVPAGARRDEPVQHLDLGRTLLDLAGLEATPFPGRDLLAEPPPQPGPRFSLEAYGRSASVEHEGWLAVLHLAPRDLPWHVEPRERHQLELFHLPDDPRTARDLVDEHPERAAALRARLIAWLGRAGPGWAVAGATDRADAAALQALGYVAPADDDAAGRWEPDDCAWCRRFG